MELGDSFWHQELTLDETDKVSLISPFSKEEIKGVTMDMKKILLQDLMGSVLASLRTIGK
jgi:hypothetical protein